MVAGFLAQPGLRTVTGMLAGARLAGVWHHTRAHRFFSAARWSADQVGLALLEVIVRLLVVPETPLLVVVDDSLFKRAGRKVFGAGWHYDPTGTGRRRTAWGNNWVVLGVLVRLPFVAHRQVCLPVLARLWQPRQPGRSKLDLACALVGLVCARHPDRQIHLVADAAYAGKALRGLPAQVTVTTRLRGDAALYALPPARRPGQRGRPRVKGDRLAELIVLAALVATRWQQAVVCCYGQPQTKELTSLVCLWYTVFGAMPVRVVLARQPGGPDGYQLAVVSTDLDASPVELMERYADRWSVEMVFPQLTKAGVGAVGGDGQRVADLDLAVGHDDPINEQLHQQAALRERGRGQPVPDGLAEALDPVGDSAELQPLPSDRVQLVLLVDQGGLAALQLPSLALELRQGDDLGQVGVQQPLLLALQLRDGLADGALAGLQLLRQPRPTASPRGRSGRCSAGPGRAAARRCGPRRGSSCSRFGSCGRCTTGGRRRS